MADEIRVTDTPGTQPLDRGMTARTDADATVTPRVVDDAGDVDDTRVARAQIEQTRARMSETIDEIEEVLIRKRDEIQDRLDVLSPVRERPLQALGIVFGAGLLLGLLTGGGDDEDGEDDGGRWRRSASFDVDEERRAELWEARARRLLRIAREQEEELEALQEGRAVGLSSHRMNHLDEDDFGELDSDVTDRLTEFVTNAVRGLFGAGRG